jgi:hypothetical protein
MSRLLQELHVCAEQQEREIVALRATVERLRVERKELLAQARFATEHANRETRAAGSLRIELLERTSVPKERLDFCCDAPDADDLQQHRPQHLFDGERHDEV